VVASCIKWLTTNETVVDIDFIIHDNEAVYGHLVIRPERKKTKLTKELYAR
jgi:hypothetical protein